MNLFLCSLEILMSALAFPTTALAHPSDDTGSVCNDDAFPVIDIGKMHGKHRFIYDPAYFSYMRIYDFLQEINAPLYAFNKLLKIIQEEYIVGQFKPSAKHPNHATFLGTLEKIFGKPGSPKKVDIILEHNEIVNGAQCAKHKSQAKKENPKPTTKDYLTHDDDDDDDESINDAEPLP
jgi:hypothetical protein